MKRKFKILTKQTRVSDMKFDDLEDQYSNHHGDWELRAEKLQMRRWRKLRHEM